MNQREQNRRNKRFRILSNHNNSSIPKNALIWIVKQFGAGWIYYDPHKEQWHQYWGFLDKVDGEEWTKEVCGMFVEQIKQIDGELKQSRSFNNRVIQLWKNLKQGINNLHTRRLAKRLKTV